MLAEKQLDEVEEGLVRGGFLNPDRGTVFVSVPSRSCPYAKVFCGHFLPLREVLAADDFEAAVGEYVRMDAHRFRRDGVEFLVWAGQCGKCGKNWVAVEGHEP